MKIDDKGLPQESQALGSTQRTEADGRAGKMERRERTGSDTLELSPDARLLHQALAAASRAPDVRSDRVEAVKAKLAAGELGQDPGRLADLMIDDLLERR